MDRRLSRHSATALFPGALVALVALVSLTLWAAQASVPAASAQAPGCAVGTWVAEDLGAVLAAAGATQGLTLSSVEGRATLTVLPDGAYETTLENVTFQALFMGIPASGTLNGSLRGVFADLGDGTVLDSFTGGFISLSASVFGQNLSLEQDIRPRDGVVTSLTCDGDRMSTSVTVSETTITQVWSRSG